MEIALRRALRTALWLRRVNHDCIWLRAAALWLAFLHGNVAFSKLLFYFVCEADWEFKIVAPLVVSNFSEAFDSVKEVVLQYIDKFLKIRRWFTHLLGHCLNQIS